jgi:hypothetical protein
MGEAQSDTKQLGYTTANLPSRGVLYGDSIPDGVIGIRKLKATEEALLLGQGAQGLDRMNLTLKSCVQLPGGFKHEDLLLTDRMATMLALRTITFGPNYNFDYKCAYCGQMQRTPVNILEDLEENTPDTIADARAEKADKAGEDVEDWTLEEPIAITLPDSGSELKLRFLRGSDEERIVKRTKRLLLQSVDAADPSYLLRIALQIVSIDEEEVKLNKREQFVRKLSATDTAKIRIEVEGVEPGIDLTVYPECRGCGAVNKMAMPFTAEFFRPSSL